MLEIIIVGAVVVFAVVIVQYIFYILSKKDKDLVDEKLRKGDSDLEHKKENIAVMIEQVKKELEESRKHLSTAEKEHTVHFTKLAADMEAHNKNTVQLQETTENLKNILSNNQLRGRWGEEVAENLLLSVGFVKGDTYLANKTLESSGTRPDFTILLPDGTKLNVDAKFPYDALLRYQDSEMEVDKKRYLSEFQDAVKNKVKQVTTRDYINPEEKTVDFVILFVPNEMIFSFIYENMNELWNDALKKKVILAGPFSFTAVLRTVFQAHKNFKYQENLQEIIKHVRVFEGEYVKLKDEIDKLGRSIESTQKQYDVVTGTRDRQLTRIIDKIQGESEGLSLPEAERK